MLHEAMLYTRGKDDRVDCFLCSHRCRIADQRYGICGVRRNQGGTLYTYAYGEAVAANVDPVEKKPLYHFLPGTNTFSIAAFGCNFRCDFCQNWRISQVTKEKGNEIPGYLLSPEEIVEDARKLECRSISYTYTEPTIFFEYAFDTARIARDSGLYNIFVSNGYMTPEAFSTIHPHLDACNVDLKSFRDEFYRKTCRARLQPVLDTIKLLGESDVWTEITTLIIPGANDSREELTDIASFIAQTDPSIPWHISRFFPAYKSTATGPTPIEKMLEAYEIGKRQGLHFIYTGNVPGESMDINCPNCRITVLKRGPGAETVARNLQNGRCANCGREIQGVFF